MKISFLIFFILSAILNSYASESAYSSSWCQKMKGQEEVILSDGTRPDCIFDEYVVEVDFAAKNKWYEAVGQALHYGVVSGKTPGIALIMKDVGDNIYLERLSKVIQKYSLPIKVWEISVAKESMSKDNSVTNLPIKKSKNGKCHPPGGTYYSQTIHFTPFKTMDDCLKSGGILPKR